MLRRLGLRFCKVSTRTTVIGLGVAAVGLAAILGFVAVRGGPLTEFSYENKLGITWEGGIVLRCRDLETPALSQANADAAYAFLEDGFHNSAAQSAADLKAEAGKLAPQDLIARMEELSAEDVARKNEVSKQVWANYKCEFDPG